LLRKQLAICVFDYMCDVQHRPPKESAVRDRLQRIGIAASELKKWLTFDPTKLEARAVISEALSTLPSHVRQDGLLNAITKKCEQLPKGSIQALVREQYAHVAGGTEVPDLREQDLLHARARISRKANIDLDRFCDDLTYLCAMIDVLGVAKGGRPSRKEWNRLMADLADIYEDATGKSATVTEDEHRAEAKERYSGSFVRFASFIDREASSGISFTDARSLPNSALGPALRRVLKARARGRSKIA
jgi:hypothetical protein